MSILAKENRNLSTTQNRTITVALKAFVCFSWSNSQHLLTQMTTAKAWHQSRLSASSIRPCSTLLILCAERWHAQTEMLSMLSWQNNQFSYPKTCLVSKYKEKIISAGHLTPGQCISCDNNLSCSLLGELLTQQDIVQQKMVTTVVPFSSIMPVVTSLLPSIVPEGNRNHPFNALSGTWSRHTQI